MTLFPDKPVIYSSIDAFPNLWFDHIAYCVADPRTSFGVLRTGLGLTWRLWEMNGQFGGVQVTFPGGFKVELIHPNSTDADHFTNRFLARRGPGPHHLTFRTKNLRGMIEHAKTLGIDLIQISLDNPNWMEAFIHPKTAGGILVQIAECPHEKESPIEPEWNDLIAAPPARFVRVDLTTDDVSGARRVFGDLLGGAVEREGSDGAEFCWNEDRRIRLVEGTSNAAELVVNEMNNLETSSNFTREIGGQLKVGV